MDYSCQSIGLVSMINGTSTVTGNHALSAETWGVPVMMSLDQSIESNKEIFCHYQTVKFESETRRVKQYAYVIF